MLGARGYAAGKFEDVETAMAAMTRRVDHKTGRVSSAFHGEVRVL